VKEADTSEVVVDKLLAAGSRDTVRSRSWTGKPARFLRTAWTEEWEGPESPGALQMPLQYMLIADAQRRVMRAPAGTKAAQLAGMPVGQIVGRMNAVRSARDVIYEMVSEYVETVERMSGELPRVEAG
jgi:NAD(P)H-dependent flavin oxidoreductase YrpB (nitropropane dioxygenase family)